MLRLGSAQRPALDLQGARLTYAPSIPLGRLVWKRLFAGSPLPLGLDSCGDLLEQTVQLFAIHVELLAANRDRLEMLATAPNNHRLPRLEHSVDARWRGGLIVLAQRRRVRVGLVEAPHIGLRRLPSHGSASGMQRCASRARRFLRRHSTASADRRGNQKG